MEQELFILFSQDVPLIQQIYFYEGYAQRAAEQIARSHRGAHISVARIVATVCEPLPDLQWTDGRVPGSGQDRERVMGKAVGLDASIYQNAETPRPRRS